MHFSQVAPNWSERALLNIRLVLIVFLVRVILEISAQMSTTAPKQKGSNYSRTGPRKFSDFSKLNLEVRELLGSRWAVEQAEKNAAINVFHSVEIVDAVLIDKNQLTLRVEFHVRQRWTATGLEFPENLFKPSDPKDVFVSAGENVLKYMWSPASFISSSRESSNCKTWHQFMGISEVPNSVVHIFPNLTILYKARLYTNVACSTNFVWYPLDKQACSLIIESYKYYHKFVNYLWEDDKLYRPVTVKFKRLLQYDLASVEFSNGSTARGGRGVHYPHVYVRFLFERKLGNNIIQVYTPTTLVVVLSWFSFWLGLDAVPGRISLLVTCMLTLVTMHSGLKGSIPPVHYITMMDVWMVGCMAFVFFSICEFVIVKYIHWRIYVKKRDKTKLQEDEETKKFNAWLKFMFASIGSEPFNTLTNSNDQRNLIKTITGQTGDMSLGYTSKISKNIPSMLMVDSELRCGENHRIKSHTPGPGSTGSCLSSREESANGFSSRSINSNWNWSTGCSKDPEMPREKNPPNKKVWVLIDKFCRGFFPFLFCTFNAIYWPILVQGSALQDANKEL